MRVVVLCPHAGFSHSRGLTGADRQRAISHLPSSPQIEHSPRNDILPLAGCLVKCRAANSSATGDLCLQLGRWPENGSFTLTTSRPSSIGMHASLWETGNVFVYPLSLLPTHDCVASAPWDRDAGIPAGAPSRAPGSGLDDASAGAKLRQGHDQRKQPLPVVLDKAQQLQPTAGRPCLR